MSQLWDHESGEYQAVVHGELWVGDGLLYMIADSPSHGLELYGWAYGELTDEWIVIY